MAAVQCDLCPKLCLIPEGESGDCRIRVNLDGVLRAVAYARPCAVHIDPVEKKPMFHFLPGTTALSIATAGCNLHCLNCQNWEISQQPPDRIPAYKTPPAEVAKLASREGCRSVAYTYNDPSVFYEYALESCVEARKRGLKNILVTAGYLNKAPMTRLLEVSDAANIDLKAFSDKFYREVCSGTLKPVLNNLVLARRSGIVLEVTNLLIPTMNDSDKDISALCAWIAENLGRDTPLHFSRFFPRYKLRHLPPTPTGTLEKARDIAKSKGLEFVYVGNITSKTGADTYCPGCGKLLVERRIYSVLKNVVDAKGRCPYCGRKIYGLWK